MVDKSHRVDVDGSMKEREWNTEEFYAVLNQHTEEVRQHSIKSTHFCTLLQCDAPYREHPTNYFTS